MEDNLSLMFAVNGFFSLLGDVHALIDSDELTKPQIFTFNCNSRSQRRIKSKLLSKAADNKAMFLALSTALYFLMFCCFVVGTFAEPLAPFR